MERGKAGRGVVGAAARDHAGCWHTFGPKLRHVGLPPCRPAVPWGGNWRCSRDSSIACFWFQSWRDGRQCPQYARTAPEQFCGHGETTGLVGNADTHAELSHLCT
jgi:hypothetical protein